MPIPSKAVIFETLNQTRHVPDIQPTLFDPIDHEHNNEYWHYSDLHNLMGEGCFPTVNGMENHTGHSLTMPYDNKIKITHVPATPDFYHDHVVKFSHSYNLDGHQYKKAIDLKLSRYACWCLSRQNPYMIFARTYFMSPIIRSDMNFSDMQNLSYQFARVHLRQKLSGLENQLAGIINKTGGSFSQFNRSITRTFFYGYSANDLKDIFHIKNKSNDPIANYMGAASLNGKIHALGNAIYAFNHAPRQNINVISEILNDELTAQRVKMIRDLNIRPELDIFPIHISNVQSHLNCSERNFAHAYKGQKIR